MRISTCLCSALGLASALTLHPGAQAQADEIFVGTGSRLGVYFQVGRAICSLVNAGSEQHGTVCSAPPTAGSIANLEDIRNREIPFGVAQSDWQFHAYNGSGRFEQAGPDEDLRALFSVHGEPFTVVARRDAGIKNLDDLPAKRVNIGNPGSGQRGTMEVVMAAKGWERSVFALANELPASQQSLALCHDRVQAMVYTVGHPNASVAQAADLCDAIIVEVKDEAIDALVDEHPFYAYVQVPGGLYAGNPDPVTTFGVKATVVTSAQVDADTVYTVVKSVFDRLDDFKKFHPAFATLTPQQMVADGLSAPLHEGALKYYREQGLR